MQSSEFTKLLDFESILKKNAIEPKTFYFKLKIDFYR